MVSLWLVCTGMSELKSILDSVEPGVPNLNEMVSKADLQVSSPC